ncbi:hypothetical protein B0H12DRAFT_1239169 [Mycena haematopus]|nr:hypothetical protein B0H12DRAFT_1239169 [Mycena haematopus]
MGFPFPSRAKLKRRAQRLSVFRAHSDVIWTSFIALKESADAFPPLKGAVSAVIALRDVAERSKHARADARDIADRTQVILDVVAEAIPDPTAVPTPMLESIERFTL